MTLLEWEVIVEGRVLLARVRMEDDGLTYDIFSCYMPQQGLPLARHQEAWTALIEALLVANDAFLLMGDLNAETAQRRATLKKLLARGASLPAARPGEVYLHKILQGKLFEQCNASRLGPERFTYRCVVRKASASDDEDEVAKHVIDHIIAGPGASRCIAGGTHIVEAGLVQYHLAVACHIKTVAAEKVQRRRTSRRTLHSHYSRRTQHHRAWGARWTRVQSSSCRGSMRCEGGSNSGQGRWLRALPTSGVREGVWRDTRTPPGSRLPRFGSGEH
jgi:hypothetical protein